MKRDLVKNITLAAVIAALYTALSIVLLPLSFGPIQLRISEALTVLPAICPPAVVGLTLGCFISNVIGFLMGANPLGVVDAFVGSAATLFAAICTAYIGKKIKGKSLFVLAPLPPVLFNGLIIGLELTLVLTGGFSLAVFALNCVYVAVGEAIACYLGGSLILSGGQKFLDSIYQKE